MSAAAVRNIAIIAGLAAVVAFVPEGDRSANFVGSVVSIAITVVLLLLGVRMYQAFRDDIYGLGDHHRALLYGSIGLFVFAMAARNRLFDTAAGTFGWFVMIGAAVYGVYTCWRRYRAYRI